MSLEPLTLHQAQGTQSESELTQNSKSFELSLSLTLARKTVNSQWQISTVRQHQWGAAKAGSYSTLRRELDLWN